jgi:hypothetical protein
MAQHIVPQGVQLVIIEATATTVSANAGRSSPAVVHSILNAGLYDIVFTATHTDNNTQSFTVLAGREFTLPFLFRTISWVTTEGSSDFFLVGYVAPRS